MRIIFMGTPQFAVVSLKRLLSEKFNIISVVTTPDKPVGRGLKIMPSPVKREALSSHLPVLQPEKLKNPSFISQIEALNADLIVVVAFRILPQEVFMKAKKGAINLHGSLLPKYRGAAPINWAIINGEKETGVSTFFIQQQVDTGNLIAQEKITIAPNMTAGELHDIMADVGADLLVKSIHMIERDEIKLRKQDESLVSKAPKIFPKDCVVSFNQPVEKVHNFIRGLSPIPGAYTYLKGKKLNLSSSSVLDQESQIGQPGELISIGDSDCLRVQCNPGIIEIRTVKLEGKREMDVESFLRGNALRCGLVLKQLAE